jgi:hypothetical protein
MTAEPPVLLPPQCQFTREDVQQALVASKGLVAATARRLGCAKQTVYNYLARFPDLQVLACEARQELLDIAEYRLFEAVERGEFKAVRLVLMTLGKDRGYTTG